MRPTLECVSSALLIDMVTEDISLVEALDLAVDAWDPNGTGADRVCWWTVRIMVLWNW